MKKNLIAWIYLIVLSLVWGSSFKLMKEGLRAYTSNEVAALRISIAFIVLLPFLYTHYKIDLKKHLWGLLLVGVLGSLIPAFLFTKAETGISSSLTGMLNALTPLFAIIVGVLLFGQKARKNQIVGVMIGFVGAVGMIWFCDSKERSTHILYSLLVVLATFFYAISVNSIKRYLSGLHSITATVWSFMFIGPVALVYLFGYTDFTQHLTHSPYGWSALGYVALLGTFGSALSIIAYNTLIKNAGVVFAASSTYLIPVVAIAWGLFDGEKIHQIQYIAVGVIVLGIWIINRNKG